MIKNSLNFDLKNDNYRLAGHDHDHFHIQEY